MTELNQKMQTRMQNLQRRFFPELNELKIVMEPHAPPDHFYQARFRFFGFFRPARKRTYLIKYHTCSQSWPSHLIDAILMHELAHISDFSKMDFFAAFAFGFKYLTSQPFLATYEKSTDLQALQRAPQLARWQIELKRHLYELAGPEGKEKYRRHYMTPENIEAWINENESKH